MTPKAEIFVTEADFVYTGFWSEEFPLKTALDTMSFLHQRVITQKYSEVVSTRDRVYFNLIVLFRLLWHHRLLEDTPHFWECIYNDSGFKSWGAQRIRDVVVHYVEAREAYRRHHPYRRHDLDSDSPDSTLARLVDQWCCRPPVDSDKDAARVRQVPGLYSRLMRDSWDAILDDRHSRERLLFGKDLNWPFFSLPSPDDARLAPGLSVGALDSCLGSTTNNESKQEPNEARPSIRQDSKPVLPVCLPLTPQEKGDRARPIQKNLLPSARVGSEPGRLTPPPVEPRSHYEEMTTLGVVDLVGQKNGAEDPIGEAEPSGTATPRKRPAPPSDELSPFSKRRQITQMAHSSSDGEQEAGPAYASDQSHGSEGLDAIPAQPYGTGGGKRPSSQNSNEPKPSVALQSLDEMIASAGGGSSTRHGSTPMYQPSSDLNEGLMPPVRQAPMGAQNGHGATPVVYYQMVNVPATLFALSQRIENLERQAEGQVGAGGTLAAVVRGLAELGKTAKKQADILAMVPNLSSNVADLEKTVKDREQIFETVDAATSELTCTIHDLKTKLGEATDTRITIAALTRRITELEKTVREGLATFSSKFEELEKAAEKKSDIQDDKIKNLEATVEALMKRLEEMGPKEAGETVE